jgi:hypothetical protein
MTNIPSILFGFALTTAYWPGITGAGTTPRWDIAALLGVVLFFAPRVRMTAAHWLGLILIAWLSITLLWSEGRQDGYDAIFKLLIAGCAFAVGSATEDLRPIWIGSAIGIGVSSAVVLAQLAGWHGIESDGGYSGLFVNRDRLAAAAALVAIAILAPLGGRSWLALPLLPALVMPQSRVAWLALAVGFLSLPLRPAWLRWGARAAALVGGIVTAVLRLGNPSDGERINLYRDTVNALTPFGHGLGSFWESFPAHAHYFDIAKVGTRPEHPHNEWLWLAYEGGFPAFVLGMVFALAIWLAAEDYPAERGIFAALFVFSLVAMPFHDPVTLTLGALVAGWCAGDHSGILVQAFDGGIPLQQGMAAGDMAERVR